MREKKIKTTKKNYYCRPEVERKMNKVKKDFDLRSDHSLIDIAVTTFISLPYSRQADLIHVYYKLKDQSLTEGETAQVADNILQLFRIEHSKED